MSTALYADTLYQYYMHSDVLHTSTRGGTESTPLNTRLRLFISIPPSSGTCGTRLANASAVNRPTDRPIDLRIEQA